MSATRDPFESALPDWVGETLREPVESHPRSRARIMEAVRALPAPRRRSAPMRPSRWLRRGLLSPISGAITSAVLALSLLLRADGGASALSDIVTVTRVLGDTVVPVHTLPSASGTIRWLDTLRIVEFVIRGSSVHAVAILGDFNKWQRNATPLSAGAPHEWRARVLVPRDALDVAYLVNDRHLIPATLRPTRQRVTPDTSLRSGPRIAG
ncbi:MAG: hypothetical protein IPP90_09470 [Gemmatimonadaceae bacterium]|nr:hypothetical protein [Gemmatimonadaceae bacterium]